MPQTPRIAPMRGGLNVADAPISRAPGQLIACENYEPDVMGYTSFSGYERFDGRSKPSDADDDATRTSRRAAITAVPGKGGVLKAWRVKDPSGVSEYAVRENAGDSNATVYKASASGWTAVPLAVIVNYSVGAVTEILAGDAVTGGTSGSTATVGRVILFSGTFAGGDAVGYFEIISPSGAFTNGEAIGNGTWTATLDTSGSTVIDHSGKADVRAHSFEGSTAENSYLATGSAVVFEINGTNVFPIIRSGATDPVNHVAVFANHLFLGSVGSLIHSGPNRPRDFTAIGGAAETVVGTTIEGLQDESFNSLVVYGADQTSYLTGTSASDFLLQPISRDTAPIAGTMQMAGSPIYADRIGVRRLDTTDTFGNWRVSTITRKIEPYFLAFAKAGITPVGSMRVRDRDLYRLFMSDGSVISIYFAEDRVEIGRLNLPIVMSCSWVATGTDTGDVVLIGASDGFVYEFDVGGSLDGEEINSFLTLAPFTAGAPRQNKRFVKASVEMTGQPSLGLDVSAEYDYGDPNSAISSVCFDATGVAGGGATLWDIATWDEAAWSAAIVDSRLAQLDGKGRNILFSIRGRSLHTGAHSITAVTFNCIYRGVARAA